MYNDRLFVLYYYLAHFFGRQPRGLVLCPTAPLDNVDIVTNALRFLYYYYYGILSATAFAITS